jgi:excisionase family DNA binding protein
MPKIIGNLQLYDLKELSSLLKMSVSSLRMYVKEGKISANKLGTKWFVSEKALEDYFNKPKQL